jgi:hypothetical protein
LKTAICKLYQFRQHILVLLRVITSVYIYYWGIKTIDTARTSIKEIRFDKCNDLFPPIMITRNKIFHILQRKPTFRNFFKVYKVPKNSLTSKIFVGGMYLDSILDFKCKGIKPISLWYTYWCYSRYQCKSSRRTEHLSECNWTYSLVHCTAWWTEDVVYLGFILAGRIIWNFPKMQYHTYIEVFC